jgi:hypothetical protein
MWGKSRGLQRRRKGLRGDEREGRVEAWRRRVFRIGVLLLYCCRGDDISTSNRMSSMGWYKRFSL